MSVERPKLLITVILLMLLLSSQPSTVHGQNMQVTTWISDISISDTTSLKADTCQSMLGDEVSTCTSHELTVKFHINNPTQDNITFQTPSGEMTDVIYELTLDKAVRSTVYTGGIFTSAVTTHQLEPGTREMVRDIVVTIAGSNNVLPDGIYQFGFKLKTDQFQQTVYNTTLNRDQGHNNIIYRSPTTISTSGSLGTSTLPVTILCTAIVISYLFRRRLHQ